MKQVFILLAVFAFMGGHFLNAQDLTALTYGNTIKIGVEQIIPEPMRYAAEKFASAKNNWISAELSLYSIGLRYERMLGRKMSIGANIYLNHFWDHDLFGIDASFRFYPRGRVFFIGCALGYYSFSLNKTDKYYYEGVNVTEAYGEKFDGLAITPEVGWKIDIGAVGGLFIQLGCAIVLPLGEKTNTVKITGNNIHYQTVSFKEFFGLPSRTLYFCMGYAF